MKNKLPHIFLLCALLVSSMFLPFSYSFAKNDALPLIDSPSLNEKKQTSKVPNVESSQDPDVNTPLININNDLPARSINNFSLQSLEAPLSLEALTTTTKGPNLIQNNSLENSASSTPQGWYKDKWLNNSATFPYPVGGFNGDAIGVAITSYTSGDAKWYFEDVPVTPGRTYEFSNYSKANVPSIITVRYKMSDGSYTYKYLRTISASTDFKQNVVEIVIPQNVVSMTMFHVIQQVGTLTTDEYSLNLITTTTEPAPTTTPPNGNLIVNSDMEIANGSAPAGWSSDKWLNNNAVFSYPATGVSGSKAAKVSITSYTSGDAKWYFTPVAVTPGLYTFSEQYTSNVTTNITVQFENKDGSFSYKWLRSPPSASSFTPVSVDFTVGSNVAKVTVFHALTSVGNLTIDNARLTSSSTGSPSGIFSTGAISLTFDDAWASQYQNAIPKLNSAGLKATFYIVSRQLADYNYSGFLSISQVKQMFNAGHEIGAHTRTHVHLTTLSPTQQKTEIQGSRDDLLAMNVGPINTFAYPYGEYNGDSLQVVKNAGFTGARTTIRGYNNIATDKYQLVEQSVEISTTLAQVKSWVDTAIANKQWLVINFHRVDNSGDQYSVTPALFNQIVDYLVTKNAPIIKISDGVNAISQ